MSDTNTSKRGYNLTLTQTTAAVVGQNTNGKTKITFKGKTMVGGREIERTVLAQGAAADEIANDVGEVGTEIALRVLFERVPSQVEGQRGGEYLAVIGKPLPPKQKAA